MARPRTNPALHRRNVALTLDPKTLEEATKECNAQGYSLSVTVDALLTDWLVACKRGKSSGPKWKTLGLATLLAGIDDQWRRDMGYTGRPVRKSGYWLNMAKRLLEADASKPSPRFVVMHEVDGKWRCWAMFKTLAGAERCAEKVTTRKTKIIQENDKGDSR